MTQPGWEQAFERAAALRNAFASIVDDVRSGTIGLDGAHARADEDPLTAAVFAVKVYEAVPGIGKVKARRAMAAIGLADDVTLGGVSPEDRSTITTRFAELLAES